MASLYRDKKSPFWYIKYKALDGRWLAKSTRFRHGKLEETRKARELVAQHTLEETRRSPRRELWSSWVPDYITTRYRGATLRRAGDCWKSLSRYFSDRGILAPQDLYYRAVIEYLPWRKRKRAHNTALLELRLLSILCDEAIRRGIISRNPASKLGIKRERGREKPELTNEQIKLIRAALEKEPVWMSHAFEIALHSGCRLSETALFKNDIDESRGTIRFRKTKGDKPFTAPLSPEIRQRLRDLCQSTSENVPIFVLPADAARQFHRFFKKLNNCRLTFHSTRVTVASRLARSGYPLSKACRLLNHSSTLVHQMYIRLQPADVADAFDHLKYDSE